jgi:autotransporter-associated beta strand protein
MNLPLRAWKEAFAMFVASRRDAPPKQKNRRSRSRQLESLEDRRMMTTLYWDPSLAASTAGSRASGTWDTTSSIWYESGVGDTTWVTGATAVFAGGAGSNVTVTISTGISVGEIQFENSGYTLASGSLPITGTGQIDVASGITDTISSTLNGSNGLTKTSAGTLILSGSNTYTGGTTISAGTLQLGDGTLNIGSVAGNITDNSVLAFYNPSNQTFSNAVSGSGSVTMNGASTAILTLSGSIAYSVGTTISSATVAWDNSSAIGYGGSYGGAVTINGGALDLNSYNVTIGELSGSTGGVVTNSGSSDTLTVEANGSSSTFAGVIENGISLDKTGSGTLILTGTNTYTGSTTITAGTLQLGSSSSIGSVAGNITDNSGLAFGNPSNQTYSGVVSGSGSLTMNGSAILTLSGSNSYYGGTTISSGTVDLGSTTALGYSGYGGLTMNGGTLDMKGFAPTLGALAGSGGYVTNSGSSATLTVEANNSSSTFAGDIETGAIALDKAGTGTLALTGANSFTGMTTIAAGTLELGYGSSVGSVGGNITDNSVLAFDNPSNQTYSGVISGSGSVTMYGSAILTLSGSNSYSGSGGTSVTAGTLQVGNSTALGSTSNALSMTGGSRVGQGQQELGELLQAAFQRLGQTTAASRRQWR